MTQIATERALWEIANNPDYAQSFSSDPDSFLGRYGLNDDEIALLKAKDVKALADRGNPHMLLMYFWVAVSGGFQSLPEYLGRLNAPA